MRPQSVWRAHPSSSLVWIGKWNGLARGPKNGSVRGGGIFELGRVHFRPLFLFVFNTNRGRKWTPPSSKMPPLTVPFLGPRAKPFHLPIQASDEKAPNVLPTMSHVPKLWRPRTVDCFLMPRYGVIFPNKLFFNAQPVFSRAILRRRYRWGPGLRRNFLNSNVAPKMPLQKTHLRALFWGSRFTWENTKTFYLEKHKEPTRSPPFYLEKKTRNPPGAHHFIWKKTKSPPGAHHFSWRNTKNPPEAHHFT